MERLIRVRSIWERRAAAALGEALTTARLADEAADRARQAHSAALASFLPDVTVAHLGRTATHLAAQARVDQARLASLGAEASRGVWQHARSELEILEKLEGHRIESGRAEERRAEIRDLDEMVVLRKRQS